MKIKFVTERGMTLEVTNPDDKITAMARQAIRDKYNNEAMAFVEECAVSLRNIKPGQKVELKSRPIEITIESSCEASP